jgi:hypothetical protein
MKHEPEVTALAAAAGSDNADAALIGGKNNRFVYQYSTIHHGPWISANSGPKDTPKLRPKITILSFIWKFQLQ